RPLGHRRRQPVRAAARRARRGRGARARPAAAPGAAERRSRPPGAPHRPSDPSHPRPSTRGSRHRAASFIVEIRYKRSHFAQHLGLAAESLERTVFEVLVNGVPIEDVIVPHALAEFDVLPANLRMTTIDISLMPMAGREYKLQRALAGVLDRYEFIVMDAPPSFGLLNLNALMASDDLLVPVLPDFLSFHGLKLLFETLGQLEDDLNHRLQRIRIVLNQYNPTTRIAREAKGALESHYPEFLSDTIVRQCTQFARAPSDGRPINAYAPSSKGARDIDALITEMMSAHVERAMERSA